MVLAWLAMMLLRPLRFRFLLNVLGEARNADYRTIWTGIVLGATANSFAPMRAGDIVLALFLRQRLGIGIHRTLVVIVADYACDFACVTVAFVAALMFAPVVAGWTDHAIVVLTLLMLAGALGLWVLVRWRGRLLGLVDRLLLRLLPRRHEQGRRIAEDFLVNLAAIASLRIYLPLIFLSSLIWGLTWLSYWFGLQAVLPGAPPAAAAFNMAAVALSFVIPLGPGGLGAFEAASVLALAVFNVPLEAAIAFAVISHALQLGCLLLFAFIAVATRQIDYAALRARPEKDP